MKQARTVLAVALVLVCAGSISAFASSHTEMKNVVWPSGAIQWEDGPVPGTKVAKLWGDWMKGGPYGALIKFAPGTMHPVHYHTQTVRIVVLSGTFVFKPEGGEETKLGPGSYLLQAGGKNHVSGCTSDAECEFFMTAQDKFDLIEAKK